MANQTRAGLAAALLVVVALVPGGVPRAQALTGDTGLFGGRQCGRDVIALCLASAAVELGSCLSEPNIERNAQRCEEATTPIGGLNCNILLSQVAACAKEYARRVSSCETKLQQGCELTPEPLNPEDLGWVEIEAVDEIRVPITDVTVTVDGVEVAADAGIAGTSTDFGPHQVTVTAPGFGARTVTTFSAGQAGATDTLAVSLAPGAPVEGEVRDQDGRGLPGVRIAARNVSSDEAADSHTDADGRYRFAALAAGTYELLFSKEGKSSAASEPLVLDGRTPTIAGAMVLQPGGVISGRVIDGTSGLPVANAVVRASPRAISDLQVSRSLPGGGLHLEATSDAGGNFSLGGLPRAELRVVALAGRGAGDPVPVDLRSSAQSTGVVLSLNSRRSIAGTVVDSSGRAISGAKVVASSSAFEALDPADRRILGLPPVTTTDSRGTFSFAALPDAGYRLYAAPPGKPSLPALLGSGAEVQAGVPVTLTVGGYGSIRGRVRFDDASVPDEFSIGSSALTSSRFAHPSGEFRLDNVAPGEHHLYLTGPQFVGDMLPRVVTVTSGEESDIGEIVVKRGRSLRGAVRRDGQPVAGATVSVAPLHAGGGPGPGSFMTKSAVTAPDGTFRIDGVHKGPVPVVASHPTAGRSRAVRIAVGDEDASLALDLEPTGELRGSVSCGAPVPALIWVEDPDQQHLFSASSHPGAGYLFEALAPGRYRVTATLLAPQSPSCTGSRTMDVDVAPGTTAALAFTF